MNATTGRPALQGGEDVTSSSFRDRTVRLGCGRLPGRAANVIWLKTSRSAGCGCGKSSASGRAEPGGGPGRDGCSEEAAYFAPGLVVQSVLLGNWTASGGYITNASATLDPGNGSVAGGYSSFHGGMPGATLMWSPGYKGTSRVSAWATYCGALYFCVGVTSGNEGGGSWGMLPQFGAGTPGFSYGASVTALP